jgi:hypothetical protein
MAHGDKEPEPIVWSSGPRVPCRGSGLERDLREICERSEHVDPELAQDVLFWLDLGGEPRDVARWLRHELGDGPGSAWFPTERDVNTPFSRDTHRAPAGEGTGTETGTGWTMKRAHPVRRIFGRRTLP